jgi:hypothetical protein
VLNLQSSPASDQHNTSHECCARRLLPLLCAFSERILRLQVIDRQIRPKSSDATQNLHIKLQNRYLSLFTHRNPYKQPKLHENEHSTCSQAEAQLRGYKYRYETGKQVRYKYTRCHTHCRAESLAKRILHRSNQNCDDVQKTSNYCSFQPSLTNDRRRINDCTSGQKPA